MSVAIIMAEMPYNIICAGEPSHRFHLVGPEDNNTLFIREPKDLSNEDAQHEYRWLFREAPVAPYWQLGTESSIRSDLAPVGEPESWLTCESETSFVFKPLEDDEEEASKQHWKFEPAEGGGPGSFHVTNQFHGDNVLFGLDPLGLIKPRMLERGAIGNSVNYVWTVNEPAGVVNPVEPVGPVEPVEPVESTTGCPTAGTDDATSSATDEITDPTETETSEAEQTDQVPENGGTSWRYGRGGGGILWCPAGIMCGLVVMGVWFGGVV